MLRLCGRFDSLDTPQRSVTACNMAKRERLESVAIDGAQYFPALALAKSLEISRQTLWRWRKRGKIPAGHRFRDGQLFFNEREAAEVRQFANLIEPVSAGDKNQLSLFNARGI